MDERTVATLLRAAGVRQDPPRQASEAAWKAVEATWRDGLRRRRRRRRLAYAVAASAAAAAVTLAMLRPFDAAPVASTAGRVDRVAGVVDLRVPDGAGWERLEATGGRSIGSGGRLRTGEDGLAGIVLQGGASLRLAPLTRVVLERPERVRLLAGRVYLDTGAGGQAGPVDIVTPDVVAQDFGTQFEIQHGAGVVRLRVREGSVVLSQADERVVAHAGEEVTVYTEGAVSRRAIAPDDPAWQWVEAIAPAPDVDGQPVRALLDWVARETGRKLAFSDPAAAERAAATTLHGRVGHLEPLEALEVMLATTDLGYTLRGDGTIEVHRQ